MWEKISNAYTGYFNYMWSELTFQTGLWWKNYFLWWLIVSVIFLLLELFMPWRKGQKVIRKDFWLDLFYNFFNFFLFSLIIYNAASTVVADFFNQTVQSITGVNLLTINPLQQLPAWAILLIGFVIRDFVQWNTHRLLHKSTFLWEFHKVHHSTQEMGWGAHLRYHWGETIVYRTLEYLPLALLGIGLHDFFVMHIFAITVGHYNHANFYLRPAQKAAVFGSVIGLFLAVYVFDFQKFSYLLATVGASILSAILLKDVWKYIFNSPEMHIWHHAKELPQARLTGVNFGLTLSVWDYLFRTNYEPFHGRDIPLGFENVENFPQSFPQQLVQGVKKP